MWLNVSSPGFCSLTVEFFIYSTKKVFVSIEERENLVTEPMVWTHNSFTCKMYEAFYQQINEEEHLLQLLMQLSLSTVLGYCNKELLQPSPGPQRIPVSTIHFPLTALYQSFPQHTMKMELVFSTSPKLPFLIQTFCKSH